jgi:manganese transport protein
MGLICVGFLYETLRIGPSASGAAAGLVPHLGGHNGLLLAVGIVGATVMPHAVYLHSGLTSRRLAIADASARRRILRLERLDVGIALGVAALVNLSMLALAAKLFFHTRSAGPVTLEVVHSRMGHLVGGGAALAFAAALLASGISSSSVGTCAGEIIMAGFIGRRIPVAVRRLVTMAPALVLLCLHVDPTHALIISQVVLCFGVPFALVPLIRITSNHTLMGEHVNDRRTTIAMSTVVTGLCALNIVLLVQQIS